MKADDHRDDRRDQRGMAGADQEPDRKRDGYYLHSEDDRKLCVGIGSGYTRIRAVTRGNAGRLAPKQGNANDESDGSSD